jgi:hypothetical protein
MRALIYAPIVHSEADLGSLAVEVRRQFLEAFGADAWARRRDGIEGMWGGLRAKLLSLPLSLRRCRLYQDGLPVCGVELEIVRDLAGKGSRNHQLLVELVGRGATLMGTEDPQLMVRDYRRLQRLVRAAEDRTADALLEEIRREGEVVLRERDLYIAGRIDETLAEGETGILFLGLLHRVDELLGGKLDIRHLIHNLPFGADPLMDLKEHDGDGN